MNPISLLPPDSEKEMSHAILVVAALCSVSTDDDTLRHYLSKATLVVSGEILTEPHVVTSELGINRHSFKFAVADVMKGRPSRLKINVMVTQTYIEPSQASPYLKKGKRVILFLREGRNVDGNELWVGADKWFAVQPANSLMEFDLNRIAEKEEREEREE
jgi:hypothetical protein